MYHSIIPQRRMHSMIPSRRRTPLVATRPRAARTRRRSKPWPKTATYWCILEPIVIGGKRRGWVARVPAVRNVWEEARTQREAKAQARQALGLWCSVARDCDEGIPLDQEPAMRMKGAYACRLRATLRPPIAPDPETARILWATHFMP